MQQQSRSLWDATASSPKYQPLQGDIAVEVVIVGAGITGLTAAILLAEKGRRVAVVEQETIGSGEGGHITVAIDARYHHVKRQYGKEAAKLVAGASRATLEKIAELVQRYAIDCHFRRVPGYLYTEKRKYVAELKNEAAAAREAGLDAQWVNEVPLPFETRGGVLWPEQAQFHPREYLAGLAKHAVAAGAQIFENTSAPKVEAGVVETEGGRITADHVFMATNVPIGAASERRSYAAAFELAGPHPDGLFRDADDPFYDFRREGTFLIVGGTEPDLADWTRERFGTGEARWQWEGTIIESPTGLPMIGRTKEQLYVSTGYGRQIATFGTLGAMLVSDLVLGESNPWKDLFAPTESATTSLAWRGSPAADAPPPRPAAGALDPREASPRPTRST